METCGFCILNVTLKECIYDQHRRNNEYFQHLNFYLNFIQLLRIIEYRFLNVEHLQSV